MNVKIEKIHAIRGLRREEISKDEIEKKLREGWTISVKINVDGQSGFMIIEDDDVDFMALRKDVIEKLMAKKNELLKQLLHVN